MVPHFAADAFERAVAWVFAASEADLFDLVYERRDDRGFLGGLLRTMGPRIVDDATAGAADKLLYDLFMWWHGFAQGSGSGTLRAEWLFEAMRGWPAGVARDLARRWCGTAVEREIVEPTVASADELASAFASSDAGQVARALVIVAGAVDGPPLVTLRPPGIELLERLGVESLDHSLAFLRVVTQFRGFEPTLGAAERIRLAMEVLVRTRLDRVAIYVADWLLVQRDAAQAVDDAFAFLIAHAPDSQAWADLAGAELLYRLWDPASADDRAAVRDVIERHLRAIPHERRQALSAFLAWFEKLSRRVG